MNNITTYNDLVFEKKRLRLVLEERKILVQAEFEEIKVKLKPLAHIIEEVEKITSKDRRNPLFNLGVDLGVNLLLKNLFLRNAGFITKLIVPFLAKNYLSHEVDETKNVFSKIGGFIKKKIRQYQQV